MPSTYANIIIEISHDKVDRPFQYKIPPRLADEIKEGSQVRIPFGLGNKSITGYVVELTDKAEYPVEKIKEIIELVPKSVQMDETMLELASWMRTHYGSTMINALRTLLPVKQKMKPVEVKEVSLAISLEEAGLLLEEFEKKHQVAKVRLLEALLSQELIAYSIVTGKLGVSGQTLKGLEQKGIIEMNVYTKERSPIKSRPDRVKRPELSKEQRQIVDQFKDEFIKNNHKTYLLHGVTGSGKTEVYMRMIEEVLAQGKQAIVLIPEIALTYQTLQRFYGRFGEQVSFIHSKLSQGERYDQFKNAREGKINIMIGPRTALFTPFERLGLIVIDEEHEGSYKSDGLPKFHTRETAVELARMVGASVVLGSATPSLEAYYRARNKEYQLFELKNRINHQEMPHTQIVDLRQELKDGNRSIFSRALQEKIEERLEKKEQIMLFINRRGYAGFVSCRECGHVMKCPHCDVSLTDHRNGKLICHYCGYETASVSNCPECGSRYISGFKVGTQQIEELLNKMYPKARVLRMDADTTKGKNDYEKILQTFSNEEADILVGTQMIVKGHDFRRVTLVGILAADLSLASNDYRAGERTFQLITQAAGRAGRAQLMGDVVIQTYQPEHPAIVHAAAQDYKAFYEEEIAYRDLMGYPPVEHMVCVLITSKNEEDAVRLAQALSNRIKELGQKKRLIVIGPSAASIGKINDVYRQTIYMKHAKEEVLIKAKDWMEQFIKVNEKKLRNVSVFFDFDPMNGY